MVFVGSGAREQGMPLHVAFVWAIQPWILVCIPPYLTCMTHGVQE